MLGELLIAMHLSLLRLTRPERYRFPVYFLPEGMIGMTNRRWKSKEGSEGKQVRSPSSRSSACLKPRPAGLYVRTQQEFRRERRKEVSAMN